MSNQYTADPRVMRALARKVIALRRQWPPLKYKHISARLGISAGYCAYLASKFAEPDPSPKPSNGLTEREREEFRAAVAFGKARGWVRDARPKAPTLTEIIPFPATEQRRSA